MLFNSFIFLLVFLPITLSLFYLSRSFISIRFSIGILVAASFIFYGYWNPDYLLLISSSIVINYALGHRLAKQTTSKPLLIFGLCLNLVLLGYFKYTNFLIDNINELFDISFKGQEIILPLALSFFTFQQIAYLIDCYRKKAKEQNFINYCLFVSFFPQLIAGPIVHHKEMMPQFSNLSQPLNWSKNIASGASLFIIGLFKKVIIADNFALYANRYFDNNGNSEIHMGDAWLGALAYHFQIYFDFSGYSDMAIGIAIMFGIVLPINFNSPYRAFSIIDFWRRWHMTLSRFLRDYLYISLGGNRKGSSRRYINLLLTMLLGGLWHGAAWTFVIWGGLHGFYLVVNHLWNTLLKSVNTDRLYNSKLYQVCGLVLTTLSVIIAWVYFRSPDVDMANRTILAMFGYGGEGFSSSYISFISANGFNALLNLFFENKFNWGTIMLAVFMMAFIFVIVLPNSAQLFTLINSKGLFQWQTNWKYAILLGILLSSSIVGMFGISEFIYFQF
jgi:alginate O-acetyltransferase complex protein AlgI